MAWVKMDDRFSGNPKVRRAWRQSRASIGLYAMALTYSAQHETDGRIEAWWVEEVLPGKDGATAIRALVDAGLWDENDDGSWVIHDYLEHNESRKEAEERRLRDRDRKSRGGKVSRGNPTGVREDSTRIPDGFHADSERNPSGVRADSGSTRARVPSRPVPSNNPPNPPEGGRRRDLDAYEAQLEAWAASVVPEADEHYRLPGARHALSVLRVQRREPTAARVRWYAANGSVNAFCLSDEVRAVIRSEFSTAEEVA